jgi:hypothetical protein
MPAEFTRFRFSRRGLKLWLAKILGKRSSQFRENWFHLTGEWLWGLDLFLTVKQPDEREELITSSGEWHAIIDEIVSRTD